MSFRPLLLINIWPQSISPHDSIIGTQRGPAVHHMSAQDHLIIINNFLQLYSAFLGTQGTLHRRGISSSTTSVQHPQTPSTTSYRWRGDRDEDNQCLGMIRRTWWSEAMPAHLMFSLNGNESSVFDSTQLIHDYMNSRRTHYIWSQWLCLINSYLFNKNLPEQNNE